MPTAQDNTFIRLSDHQFSQLTAQVIKHRNDALASRSDFPIRHSDRYRRFLADPTLRPPGPWPESSRLFIPTTRSVFERLHAEAWQTILGDPAQITVKPFGDEDGENAEMAGRFLHWTLESTVDWVGTTIDLLFDALLDSVGVAKIMGWTPPWDPPSKDARRFLKRTVRMDALDLGMLLVAPDAEDLQYPQGQYVAQEFFLSKDDLLRMEWRGFNVPQYDNLGHSQQLTDRKRLELEREGHRVVEFHPESIPFVESYERFILDDHGGEIDLIVSWFPDAMVDGSSHNVEENHGRIAGVRKLIDVFPQDDRPRRPFFPITFWPQPRQWRGMNVPDRLESMQDLINRIHEQLVNYGEVSMLPYVFANTFLTGELPDLRTVRPGSTVTVDDVGGLQFAPTRSLNRHFAEIIQLGQAQVERDSNVTDFSLGRQAAGKNAPRTASGTAQLLAETRRSYSMLIRKATKQFENMLSFKFRLWQSILPDGAMVQIFDPEDKRASEEEPKNLWDRLFSKEALSATGAPAGDRFVARRIRRQQISGMFDAKITVNPEASFDRQVLSSLFQVTAPVIQEDYPIGLRIMLKRLWSSMGQKGFDDVYPEEIANLQQRQRMLTLQTQLAVSQQELDAVIQQEAQNQLAEFESAIQESSDNGGEISPDLINAIRQMMADQDNQHMARRDLPNQRLPEEERQAIFRLVRSQGWYVVMRDILIPLMQQATSKIDALQNVTEHQANIQRGVVVHLCGTARPAGEALPGNDEHDKRIQWRHKPGESTRELSLDRGRGCALRLGTGTRDTARSHAKRDYHVPCLPCIYGIRKRNRCGNNEVCSLSMLQRQAPCRNVYRDNGVPQMRETLNTDA
jgi:hypothetical protein